MVLGLGWPRGVGMVRKFNWYLLTLFGVISGRFRVNMIIQIL